MKRIDAVTMYNVLVQLQDKNKIKDSKIRVALIQNLLATKKIAEENEEYMKNLREQYKTEESEKISKIIAETIQKHSTATTAEDKAILKAKIDIEQQRLDEYFAPFQEEWQKIVREHEQEEISVKLAKVSISALDAATADMAMPMASFVALEPMFKTE
jgi:deoxyribodipyrimidine photolyase